MKLKFINILSILFLSALLHAQWQPISSNLITPWGEDINPDNVLHEYPRPIMERSDWMNLNGLWQYAIVPVGTVNKPNLYEGDILVPFPIESNLSGVGKKVGAENELWYKRSFEIPQAWKNKRIKLNFGAVDWQADVFINKVKIGSHTGGFTPFSFDITPFIKSGEQELTVRVWDPTSSKFIPKGKQRDNIAEEDMGKWWYSPVTGIWQTVWLEPVEEKHFADIRYVSDIDNNKMNINVFSKNTESGDLIEIRIFDGTSLVSESRVSAGEKIWEAFLQPTGTGDIAVVQTGVSQTLSVTIPNAKLWSPNSPFLYKVEANLYSNGKLIDCIKSYCAMRKVSMKKDATGIVRIQLNNKDLFNHGVLDQGYWCDGLYTAPSDEALKFDIQKTKDLGFNMIRKHVKVEPARWYMHCDKIGVLVWQDMPNAESSRMQEWQNRQYYTGNEPIYTSDEMNNFCKEWKEIIDFLYSHPSIIMWIPFNESWGQFKTVDISKWTKKYDPSRLVNAACGGNFFKTGDVLSLHNYPNPEMYLFDPDRVNVMGEYGPTSLTVTDHSWGMNLPHDPIDLKKKIDTQTTNYINVMEEVLRPLIEEGFSGAVYCQLSDCYKERNGFVTFDRKVIKFDEDRFRNINLKISNSFGFVKNDFLSGYTAQGEAIEKYQYLKSGTIPDPDDPAKLNQWNGAFQEDGVTNTESPVTGAPLSYDGYVGSNDNSSIILEQLTPYLARHSVYSLIEDNTYGQNCYYLAFLVNVSSTTNTRVDRVFATFNGHQKGSVFRVGVSVMPDDDGFNFSLAYRDENQTDPTSTINVKRSFDQTYLVVLKHDFSTNTASLFVNPEISATELTPDATISTSGATFTSIRGISLKARSSYGLTVGGIRFSDSWDGVIGY